MGLEFLVGRAESVEIDARNGQMILAITNQKGGVGKTTTAINLASALALRGQSTLLIDLDPQANSTLSFVERDGLTRSVYDAIAEPDCPLDEVIRPAINQEKLWVAPARISLAKLEVRLGGQFDAHFRLKELLDPLRDRYQQVVIDCPPMLGLLTVNALVAATHLLIPIQSSYYALEGTDDLLDTVARVRTRANTSLQILGVLITMHDRRTLISQNSEQQIRKVFGDKVFTTMISKNVRLEESPAYQESVFSFAPNSRGAADYYSLCEEVMDRA